MPIIRKMDKEFISYKDKKLRFNSTTAILVDSARSCFRLNLGMSVYRKLTKEINYIDHNINSIDRRINSDGFYTNMEIDQIKTKLNSIYYLMNHEYMRLVELKFVFTSDN